MRNSDSITKDLISRQALTCPNAQENQYSKTSTLANLDSNDNFYKIIIAPSLL
jgi:hypothetical protein